jgi:hypothetical protein
MKEPDENQFRELSWRQRLTDAERAALQKHFTGQPEAKADWETELRLTELLEQLPEAPAVSSNFTARVMQAVEREGAALAQPRSGAGWTWLGIRVWLARAAVACVIVGASGLVIQQRQLAARKVTAQDVARLAEAYSAAGPTSTEDFDAIRRLNSDAPAKPDTELIAAMQ